MTTQPILAFDCACEGANIALMVDGRTVTRQLPQAQQAAELVSTIDHLLHEHDVAYGDLSCIVTTVGPGSFTGVRIGLAALHGFALVSATPVKTLTTLAAIAWQVATQPAPPEECYITLRAGKGEVYAQAFRFTNGQPSAMGDIFLAPETKTDWDKPCHSHAPSAALLCSIAHALATVALADALPLYIRPPDAKVPQPLAWLASN